MKRALFFNILICCFPVSMLCSCVGAYIGGAPSPYYQARATAARTQTGIATVLEIHNGKNDDYTRLSFYEGGIERTIRVNYCIDGSAYRVGDKLAIQYDPLNLYNVKVLMDQPYFAPGELPDTTEGVIHSINNKISFTILYKTFDPVDSLDVNMMMKTRYFSQGILDTSIIKLNCVYKILYNKYKISDTWAEILFTQIKDSSHQELNRYLYGGLGMLSAGNPIASIADLNRCILMDPGNAYYFFQRAKAYENVHENEKALEDFSKYIQMVPDDQRGYQRRAAIYFQEKKYEEAQKDVNTLFSLNDESAEAYYLQGVLYYHKEEYQKAIDSYTRALELSTGKQREVYYYDRAVAREKLMGGSNEQSRKDYLMAGKAAELFDEAALHGHRIHAGDLHYNEHSVYVTFTSDNTLSSYSDLNSHMRGELVLPATSGGIPVLNDDHFLLNTAHRSSAISKGLVSLEVGGFKRFYVRLETGATFNNGIGSPGSLRATLGFNIKLTKNDFIIIRPELGCTYQNRRIHLADIPFGGYSLINIKGHNFHRDSHSDAVTISFRENVLNFSPALGVWLFPYSSKVVLRLSGGYNWCVFQNYSIFASCYKNHLRENLNDVNITFSNTNGQKSNFFHYQGLFAAIGIGVRI
jgi:tetratricopeptide (TPR) repeat protein